VLGGDGGDELFAGYDRYYGVQYADHLAKVPAWIRSGVIDPILQRVPDGNWYKSKAHQLKWLNQISFSKGGARYANSLSYFYFQRKLKASLYGPLLCSELGEFDAESLIADAYEAAHAVNPVDRMIAADYQIRLPDHPVMVSDRIAMAHGLEVRSPFMDHQLVEYMARVPVQYKVRGRSLRYLQKRLAERYLPDEITRFPKQGFATPAMYLLKDQFRRIVPILMTGSHLASAGLIDADATNHLVHEHMRGRSDHGNRLWVLLNAEIWYRMFIDGQSKSEIENVLKNT